VEKRESLNQRCGQKGARSAMRKSNHFLSYAISGPSNVYHLLYPNQDYTLCGFKAEKNAPQIPSKAGLHVVEFLPPRRKLCKQCDKMNGRRQGDTGGPDSSGSHREILMSQERFGPEHAEFQVHQ
jgi:hypothetical protein